MRRLAAVLACISVLQSAVLRTGALCDGHTAVAGEPMAAMPGMPEMPDAGTKGEMAGEMNSATAGAGLPLHQGPDRHHDGAHCPIMTSCVEGAVSAALTEAGERGHPPAAPAIARIGVAHTRRTAPEPPPPKS